YSCLRGTSIATPSSSTAMPHRDRFRPTGQRSSAPTPARAKTGRIRPGPYTGTLPVNVCVGGRHLGSFELEVRARKLDYLSHYKWMLRDLADVFAEAIMRRFAPTEARFTFRPDGDAPTL